MKSAAGDSVDLQAPGGREYLTVLEVCYECISVEPFREPPGSEASAKRLPRRRHPLDEVSEADKVPSVPGFPFRLLLLLLESSSRNSYSFNFSPALGSSPGL